MMDLLQNLSVGWALIGGVLCIVALTRIFKSLLKLLKTSDEVYDFLIDAFPVAVGLGLGFIPDMRVEGIESLMGRVTFFLGIGGFASSAYALIKAGVNVVLVKFGAKPLPPSDPPA